MNRLAWAVVKIIVITKKNQFSRPVLEKNIWHIVLVFFYETFEVLFTYSFCIISIDYRKISTFLHTQSALKTKGTFKVGLAHSK